MCVSSSVPTLRRGRSHKSSFSLETVNIAGCVQQLCWTCHKNSTLIEKDYNLFCRIARQTYRQLGHLVANNKGISLTTVVPQEETDIYLNVGPLKITQILTCKVKRSWFILTVWWSTCIIITSVWTVTCRPTCLYSVFHQHFWLLMSDALKLMSLFGQVIKFVLI